MRATDRGKLIALAVLALGGLCGPTDIPERVSLSIEAFEAVAPVVGWSAELGRLLATATTAEEALTLVRDGAAERFSPPGCATSAPGGAVVVTLSGCSGGLSGAALRATARVSVEPPPAWGGPPALRVHLEGTSATTRATEEVGGDVVHVLSATERRASLALGTLRRSESPPLRVITERLLLTWTDRCAQVDGQLTASRGELTAVAVARRLRRCGPCPDEQSAFDLQASGTAAQLTYDGDGAARSTSHSGDVRLITFACAGRAP